MTAYEDALGEALNQEGKAQKQDDDARAVRHYLGSEPQLACELPGLFASFTGTLGVELADLVGNRSIAASRFPGVGRFEQKRKLLGLQLADA
jgi:hypothetical protein